MLKKLVKSNIRKFSNQVRPQIEIFINDKPYKVDPSYTIFQAAYEQGIMIPRFCYHERLSVAGNCRMCLVEVEKSPKPVASCAANIMPGMRIHTNSEKTRIARGGVMEFLLANHPLDCPICDQAGECDLQDISMVFGYHTGRYNEYKRATEDKNFGPIVNTIMNRCIHCTRCVRFAREVAGVNTLSKVGRGKYSEIGTYVNKMIDSELSGNLVDVCPVGALTSGPYAFTSRPWELQSYDTIDVLDSTLSHVQADSRVSEVMRILPRVHEEINEEWISDKQRYAYDGLTKQRLTVPLKRNQDNSFEEITWEESLQIVAQNMLKYEGEQMAAIVGDFVDVEGLTALKDTMQRMGCEDFDIRDNHLKLNPNLRSNYVMNSKITGIEETDLLILVGCNPRIEAPVLNSRILKSTNKNNLKVAVIGTPQDLTYDYMHLGQTTDLIKQIAEGKHAFSERLKKAEMPMIIVGQSILERPDSEAIQSYLQQISQESNIINKELQWNGYNILHSHSAKVGALDIGLPSKPQNKTAKKFVYIIGNDNIRPQDIPEDAFVVYQGTHGDEGAYYADIILPSAAYTEKTGTYVSTEGRVCIARKVVQPIGQSKEDWQILRALSEELGQSLPYDSTEEIRYRMAELAPHLLKYDYIEDTLFGELALQNKNVNKQNMNQSLIVDPIDNFYMTDSISRNSVTMAKCSAAFNKIKNNNFKKITQD